MTTQEIADRLYELCKVGQFETAQNELYSSEATSTEFDMAGTLQTITGLESIKEKGKNFQNMIEEHHGGFTNEPKVFGNTIFMEMGMDVTMKGQERMNMAEMCQYEVADGKIKSERFYF
jgi:limonene-1,2-epoxide hydrolase